MTGIEPAYSAWEADVLPLNYIGMVLTKDSNPGPAVGKAGGRLAVSLRNWRRRIRRAMTRNRRRASVPQTAGCPARTRRFGLRGETGDPRT